jgi:thiol:disulfide interchange protein DsbD
MKAFRFARVLIPSFFSMVLLTVLLAVQPAWSLDEADPLLVEATTQPTDWSPGQAGQLTLKLTLPKGYHAYEDKFQLTLLEPDGFHLGPWKMSGIKKFYDKFSKKDRTGFEETSTVTAGVEAPARFAKATKFMKLEVVYQACSTSYCLFPTTKIIDIPVTLVGAPEPASASSSGSSSVLVDSGISPVSWLSTERLNTLLNESWFLALFFVFLAGVLTSFTPCIFPMIPITLAILGHGAEKRSRWQNFLLSLCYVHGIATTYSILGIAAASSGALFGASLGNPWVLGTICVLFFAMALSMYGVFELQVPAFLRNTLGTKKSSPGFVGAYFSGMIAGVVASPCVGPILVAILAWVATSGSKLYGFVLLFTYAMGLGLIFLFLGVFTSFTRRLPRSGPWLEAVKFLLGTLMLGAFYYYLSLLIPARWHDVALGIGLLVLGSIAGAFAPLKGTTNFQKVKKGIAQAFLVIAFGYLALGVFDLRPLLYQRINNPQSNFTATQTQWLPYTTENLKLAESEGRPVLIDFWAEWCAACHELEEKTFRDPKVMLTLSKFVLLRYDATKDSAELRALKTKWKIQGLPTVLFVNPQGVWLEDLTLTQFEKPGDFLPRALKALN